MSDVVVASERVVVVYADPRTIVVRGPGIQGPPGGGVPGPPGPPGPSGSDSYYLYTQSTPAGTWIISHDFGRYANVLLMDASRRVVDSDVVESDLNTVTVMFSVPFAGFAVLT